MRDDGEERDESMSGSNNVGGEMNKASLSRKVARLGYK